MNMGNVAISGSDTDYSGTYIHHTTFSGNAREHIEDERGLVYSISLEAAEGYLDGIRIEDSGFYDGADLGAIRVFQSGDSRGNYLFQRNDFSDLGGRAYFVRTRNSSSVETVILDSTADNIGRGDRNSDSIIPYLMGPVGTSDAHSQLSLSEHETGRQSIEHRNRGVYVWTASARRGELVYSL
jgi:hypothetical protein